jgi:hypothetical protein
VANVVAVDESAFDEQSPETMTDENKRSIWVFSPLEREICQQVMSLEIESSSTQEAQA